VKFVKITIETQNTQTETQLKKKNLILVKQLKRKSSWRILLDSGRNFKHWWKYGSRRLRMKLRINLLVYHWLLRRWLSCPNSKTQITFSNIELNTPPSSKLPVTIAFKKHHNVSLQSSPPICWKMLMEYLCNTPQSFAAVSGNT
jgi:hypothetical protein